jgi:hypothetical protein
LALSLAVLLSFAVGARARAGEPTVRADEPSKPTVSLQCERVTEPGRVRCDVEARSGNPIRWGDVEVLAVPDFAQALKGRISPQEATSRDEAVWRWSFAVVAKRAGTGEITVRVRLVSCAAKDRCTPHSLEVHTRLQAG